MHNKLIVELRNDSIIRLYLDNCRTFIIDMGKIELNIFTDLGNIVAA
jgi:hypothetical protein